MRIDAAKYENTELNKLIRESTDEKLELENVLGHRYIGAGLSGKEILINGTPGNALGAYRRYHERRRDHRSRKLRRYHGLRYALGRDLC